MPATQVQAVETSLDWPTLGAIPEMLQTAWGSLYKSLILEAGDRLLIRGGTTSVGLAAAAIAKNCGAFVAATTRRPDREKLLRACGVDQVFIDAGSIARQVREVFPGGVDKVLELVGATTLEDLLRCAKPRGTVCMTGMVSSKWSFDSFSPMDEIPTAVNLTTYSGGVEISYSRHSTSSLSRSRQARCMCKSAKSFISTRLPRRIVAWKTTRRVVRSLC